MPRSRIPLLLSLLAMVGVAPVTAQLTQEEARIARWVEDHHEEAVDLLQEIVDINSGTMNLEGVRAVGARIRTELDALGLETEWIDLPQTQRAGHLFAMQEGTRGRRLLLIGHLDTVFEEDHPFQRFEREGSSARGPGVNDMKGGDVVLLYALKALHAAGALEGTSLTVAFIGDEESPGLPLDVARGPLVEAAREAEIALGFEGGVRDDGGEYATVARRSASEWILRVEGRQGHSSGIFSPGAGAGAIFEAARILNAFYQEVRGEEYLTFNAGSILGGTDVSYDEEQNRGEAFGKTNVIPQTVVVHGGIRTISQEQLERARARMREVVARHLPETSASISFTDSYPPMAPSEANYALMDAFVQASQDLGLGSLEALDPGRRGAADISFAAPWVDAALAGMGPVGSGAHSPEERLDLDSLRPAIQRAALLIYRLTRASPVL